MIERLTLSQIRGAQYLQRWHMIQMHHRPSLADHSFQVVMIAAKIALDTAYPASLSDIMEYSLCHDISETAFGDIPPTSGIDKSKLEYEFWGADILVDPNVSMLVKLADKIDNYLTFKECGVDRVQHIPGTIPQSIESKLYNDLHNYLCNFSDVVNKYVKGMLNEKSL